VFEAVYYGIKSALEEQSQPEKISLKQNGSVWELPAEREKPSHGILPLFKKEDAGVLQIKSSEVFIKDLPQEEIYKKHNYSTDNRVIINSTNAAAEDIKPAASAEYGEQERTEEDIPEFCVLGEIFNLYILVSYEDKLLLVDKHAAHERLKYEELKQNSSVCLPQAFLDPPVVALNAEDKAAILENRELLLGAGFDIEDFGGLSVIVRGMPGIYQEEDAQSALSELAARLEDRRGAADGKLDALLRMIACKSAIKSGDILDRRELESLVGAILRDKNLRNCPHGRPIIASLDKSELEKYFKRTV
jgi:DNA mismatch repair protein MutL